MSDTNPNWLATWQTRAREAVAAFNQPRRAAFYLKTDAPPVEPLLQGDDASLLPALSALSRLHLDQEIVRLHPLTAQGTHHRLVHAELADGEQIVFRLAAPGPVPAFELGIDEMLAGTLKQAGVPVTRFCFTDHTRAHLPCDVAAMSLAAGSPLKTFEDAESQFMTDTLLEDWGGTLALLHQITADRFGLLDVTQWVLAGDTNITGLLPRWRDHIHTRLQEHVRACRDLQAVDATEAAAIERLFAGADDLLNTAPSRLLHGDPGHHNAFSDGARITAVIDWEDALAGDPVFDLAYWGTFVRDWMREPLLRGYSEISPLPDDFERRYWLYFLRVSLSKTVHRHRAGLQDQPGRHPASQRIQRALAKLK